MAAHPGVALPGNPVQRNADIRAPDRIGPCTGPRTTAPRFRRWAANVYHPSRWQRERPAPRTIRAQRRALLCAAGPGHHRAIKRTWRKLGERFHKYRRLRIEAEKSRCLSRECNIRMAEKLARERGLPGSEFSCLVELWDNESGWSYTATNPTSGAYGIPQALPGSKMGSTALGRGWRAVRAQILWGLDYIAGRYGTPCGALSAFYAMGWY